MASALPTFQGPQSGRIFISDQEPACTAGSQLSGDLDQPWSRPVCISLLVLT